MEYEKIINFKDISLKIEEPNQATSDKIFESFGHERFETVNKLQTGLIEANNAYFRGDYYQYVIYYKKIPVGLLKMETISTRKDKLLNNGQFFGESSVFKMNLIVGDEFLIKERIMEIVFSVINYSKFNKGILFATLPNDHRFDDALKGCLFKKIIDCRYSELIKNSKNSSSCKFFFFNSEKSDFILKNDFVKENRKRIENMYNYLPI